MTLFPVWLTFGEGSITSAPVQGAQWVWRPAGQLKQAYAPRVRPDVWVETGHVEDVDPTVDTRDRP